MIWVALALVCAFSLASADALTKKYLSDYSALEITAVRFVWTGALLVPWILAMPWPDPPPAFWGWMAAMAPLDVLGLWLYMRALRIAPLHDTVPYLAFTPVFTAVTGRVLLGEELSATGMAGVVLVALGGYLLNALDTHSSPRHGLLAPVRRMFSQPGPRLMLSVAAIYSLTAVIGKATVGHAPPRFVGAMYFVVLGALTLAGLATTRPAALPALLRRPRAHAAIAACYAVMVVTHFIALDFVATAYMISVKRTSLLFGIVYGALLFGEPRLARHLLIGTIMVAGVALIVATPGP
ncbi:MAG: EamA family transporter [Gammaproteobacteria bacterium]